MRSICSSLPGVIEKTSHGTPAFFAGRQFAVIWPTGHHEHHFPHLWCAAPPGTAADLVDRAPERFFRPPYVGGRGWVGLRLDGVVDWGEVEELMEEAYRTVAPPSLLARLSSQG